jgi:hypothetical protein
VFGVTTTKGAALVQPFTFTVDDVKWRDKAARKNARTQSPAKMAALKRILEEMLRNGVIRRSQADRYSHVHLVPKPPADFRLTIDFRVLNECCTSFGWPIPKIKEIFLRIAEKKPKLFAKLDLTWGYWQIPLLEEIRRFTAFITHMGTFEWDRLPMGLKGAGSWFQQIMAQCFHGLLYEIMEIYLDDLMVYASTWEDYMNNIRTVLQVLRRYNLIAKPSKCYFGLRKIEAVGHILSQDGLSMSWSKIEKVMQFPRPVLEKQMKSFLGLANYFRDHIRNHSAIVHPLN